MNLALSPNVITVLLRRDDGETAVTLRPLPLGFHRRLKERGLVPPAAPRKAARDSGGRVLRDERGMAVLTEETESAAHLTAVDRYQERLAAVMLAESLTGDVVVETPPPAEGGDWSAYADAVLAELDEAGVTPGDLATLCRGVCAASGLLSEAVTEAGESLFPGPAGGGD